MMKDGTMPESQEESNLNTSSPKSRKMQMELHTKGAALTKAWADLFSFITQYQAELTLKENVVEIAEKEISVRRKQLEEMKPALESDTDEISKLQELVTNQERQLHQVKSDSAVKEQLLQRVQCDLSHNQELVEKLQCDLQEKQNDLVKCMSNLEQYKSDLTVKQEQLEIKENLLKKLENQLMKENTELREQLDMETKAHEITKRNLKEKKKSVTASRAVTAAQDSPTSPSLSRKPGNFEISNVHLPQTQPHVPQLGDKVHHSPELDDSPGGLSNQDEGFDPRFRWQTADRTDRIPKYSESSYNVQSKKFTSISPSPKRMKIEPEDVDAEESEVFFPLSVSAVDTSLASALTGSGQMPGTPSSGTSESSQGPVPVSGPIPSSSTLGMPPGGEGIGGEKCGVLRVLIPKGSPTIQAQAPVNNVTNKSFPCEWGCSRSFTNKIDYEVHVRLVHTGEPPYQCPFCHRVFTRSTSIFRRHLERHKKELQCSQCPQRFWLEKDLLLHKQRTHDVPTGMCRCMRCGLIFENRDLMRAHHREMHYTAPVTKKQARRGVKKKCTQSFKWPDKGPEHQYKE